MRPAKPQSTSSPRSIIEFFNPEFELRPHFQPGDVEQSIASLRLENERLRRMAAILEEQTRSMRATWEKAKLR